MYKYNAIRQIVVIDFHNLICIQHFNNIDFKACVMKLCEVNEDVKVGRHSTSKKKNAYYRKKSSIPHCFSFFECKSPFLCSQQNYMAMVLYEMFQMVVCGSTIKQKCSYVQFKREIEKDVEEIYNTNALSVKDKKMAYVNK